MTKEFAFAAALMLGGMTGAYAQNSPPEGNKAPPPAQMEKSPAASEPSSKSAPSESAGAKGDTGNSQMERRVDDDGKGGDGKKSGKAADKDKDGKGDKKERQADDRKDYDTPKTGANDKSDDKASSKGAEAKDKDSDKVKRAETKDADKAKGADAKDADKSKQPDAKADNKASDKDSPKSTSTTGAKDVPAIADAAKNAPAKDAAKDAAKDGAKTAQPNGNTAATPPADAGKQPNATNQAAQTGDKKDAAAAKSVQLTTEKKERVRTAFKGTNVRHIDHVDITINVGTRAPSDWDYAEVPVVVIETVPEYRGYRYAWIDDRYVIVEPSTYEVVAIIDAPVGRADASSSGSSGGGRSSRCADLALNDDDRAFILRSVEINRGVTINGVELGWSVPSSIELRVFPDPVISRSAKLGGCRYFVVEDRIAIVDPEGHNVVLLLDKRS